jgi:hypothetical protein
MKSKIMKHRRFILVFALAFGMATLWQACKTDTKVEPNYVQEPLTENVFNPNAEVPVPVDFVLDTTFGHEKSHSNVNWKARYYDFSDTWLTGRFGEFHFVPDFPVLPGKLGGVHAAPSKGVALLNYNANPKYPATQNWSAGPNTQSPPAYFRFNASDLSKNYFKAYVLVSTLNTSEPGRDQYIQCGQNYMGTQWMDSTRQVVDPTSDTAWLEAVPGTWKQQGNGYTVTCNFTFNRYLHNEAGKNDGDPITKPVTVYVTYNGQQYVPGTGGALGTLRCGFTASFNFKRSDHMDKTASKLYLKNPTAAEKANSDAAFASNKTYGTWSGSVGDDMFIQANMVFSKKQ